MNIELIKRILEKNPQLKTLIKQGRFLTGYTDGGASGAPISIFLCKSPWSTNCIKAVACGYVPAGDVLIVSHEPKWSLTTHWQAYSAVQSNTFLNFPVISVREKSDPDCLLKTSFFGETASQRKNLNLS